MPEHTFTVTLDGTTAFWTRLAWQAETDDVPQQIETALHIALMAIQQKPCRDYWLRVKEEVLHE